MLLPVRLEIGFNLGGAHCRASSKQADQLVLDTLDILREDQYMKPATNLNEYMLRAPSKVKAALATAGLLVTLASASIASPVHAADSSRQIDLARTAPIVQTHTSALASPLGTYDRAIEHARPMQAVSVSDMKTINGLNARTSDMLRDANEIATRLYDSKAWHGDMFTPEEKAKNIAQAFMLAQLRADSPDLSKLDDYIVNLKADTPDNFLVNNVLGDLNFKREILRDASIELSLLIAAVRENRPDDIETHREAMSYIRKDASYAMDDATDWSLNQSETLLPKP